MDIASLIASGPIGQKYSLSLSLLGVGLPLQINAFHRSETSLSLGVVRPVELQVIRDYVSLIKTMNPLVF